MSGSPVAAGVSSVGATSTESIEVADGATNVPSQGQSQHGRGFFLIRGLWVRVPRGLPAKSLVNADLERSGPDVGPAV